ncbi:DUF4317 domain-containing protein [Gracilibacillus alcaliphilus]|uniref:DUF4317 domain-containing protein n=1 Tax=Gracilibacillus alcaliphilus TaxID=1401441 RepID=UPI0019571DD2|nr:DUF4317 domain-containing protein [Gracilibacillus alcaliphilus]MBM7677003.1 hypothetical protein [Gracilibacillus alcaliphilus]
MNKQDIATIRKQFKVDNDKMKVHEIFNVYIMKESSDIYHQQSQPFEMLDQDEKELFMINFKKLLTGQLDEKLFELKFQSDVEDSSQLILHKGLLAATNEEWQQQMLLMVEKILQDRQYEMDVVITFIHGEYVKPMRKHQDGDEGSHYDSVYHHPFILCSINKTQDPKKELQFDYIQKQFKYNVMVDPIINLQAPMGGFLFPCITDNAQDVNRVLYVAGKANEPDEMFIEEVLNAEETMTAKDDKIAFEEVVRDAVGHQLNSSTLANVYEEIHRVAEDTEEEDVPTIDYKDVERILTSSGIEDLSTEKVETAFKNVIDDTNYELKARNIVPKFNSKSIKINTKVANISVSPEDLRHVRQVQMDGRRYLMIEVEEDTVIDGFTLIPEAFK